MKNRWEWAGLTQKHAGGRKQRKRQIEPKQNINTHTLIQTDILHFTLSSWLQNKTFRTKIGRIERLRWKSIEFFCPKVKLVKNLTFVDVNCFNLNTLNKCRFSFYMLFECYILYVYIFIHYHSFSWVKTVINVLQHVTMEIMLFHWSYKIWQPLFFNPHLTCLTSSLTKASTSVEHMSSLCVWSPLTSQWPVRRSSYWSTCPAIITIGIKAERRPEGL